MKKLVFLFAGTAALGLSACNNNNQDAVGNAEMNQPAPELNEQANEAAMDAANAQAAALGNLEQQLNDANAAADNVANPTDDEEQNVSGM